MLTLERLKTLLSYDPETGCFTRLVGFNNGTKVGDIAGRVHRTNGYVYIKVDNVAYLAHRLAWFYTYGEWPEGDLDHDDKDKTNQRMKNLRPATDVQNGYNRGRKADNTSGYKGVTKHTQTGRWQARISVEKKRIWLGFFDTAEEAHAAYSAAAIAHHGKYARIH